MVQSLQVAVHGLGVEEVNRDGNAGRDDSVHNVVLVSDGIERDRSDHDNHEVPQPVVSSRDGGHGDTETHGSDFGTVEEVTAQETNRIERVEKEDEDGRNNRRVSVVLEAVGDGEDYHADRHTSTADHEDLSATESVDGEEGDEAAEELPGHGA